MRHLRAALYFGFGLLALSAARAEASPDASPVLLIDHVVPGLCEQPPCRVRLSLLSCGERGPSLAESASRPLNIVRLGADASAARAPVRLLGRFATLAGTFMGRSDAAALGVFRLRFKVILE
ncbi:MAG: hypothetical protein WC969_02230 [Elusimicrobiota bacterium]|jgi:hypothetical protein